ncbi:alpha-aminoadipic semialdehyde synthase, mitochondrial-like [Portunus trituberculatus]|uniref:alpha-aminoadipic semialdehyde synthase, mitochondrial-like n=1 Tax=Portunus trituberculatus TaxID=210409 RepID=UPI001E1CE3F0|nr:alpha-aminoadipic semialdehyde synthase, mitochondrial-like [Portunus trituberculatus]
MSDIVPHSRASHKAAVAQCSHQVLVLGAGYVAGPVVDYLSRDVDTSIILASEFKAQADELASKHPNVEPVLLNIVERPDLLSQLVESADVVVSLLPYSLHPTVAQACIDAKTHLVTASYLTPAMKELHEAALDAGVTIVNEVGLDPGIDHMLAMECFDQIHSGGGKVDKFVSFCGGLPAPQWSTNPLRYKFSWSPRGVLLNTLSPARYLQDGQIVDVESGGGLLQATKPYTALPGFNLEGFPNRDSTIYKDLYGIPEASTLLRGTLRFEGFSEICLGLIRLGLFDPNPHPMLHTNGPDVTWKQLLCSQLHQLDATIFEDNFRHLVSEAVGPKMTQALADLGLLSSDQVRKAGSPLDTLSLFLASRLRLGPAVARCEGSTSTTPIPEAGESDLVVLRHEITANWPDGSTEVKGITLVEYGNPNGYSAMARTVGLPAAMCTKMVLGGEIQTRGCVLPLKRDIYQTVLARLRQEGIQANTTSTFV